MKTSRFCSLPWSVLAAVQLVWLAVVVQAGNFRTQTITLHRGWNAVFLEVTPTASDPAAVFMNTPVTIIATYFAVQRPVQFIQNPSAIGWNKDGWGVWYAPSRPDAFLSSLQRLNGNRAYLMFAEQDFVWNVAGTVTFLPTIWKSDSFNLVGFSLDGQSPPTFDQFFSASKAHSPLRAYRLVNDQWTLVTDPVRTSMRAGEACWIYSRGGSDYQGPLAVKLAGGPAIDFSNTLDSWINLANQSGSPLDIRILRISEIGSLPLAYTILGVTQGSMGQVSVDLPTSYALPTLEPGAATSFWLTLRRDKMTSSVQTGLIKITTDLGVQFWIPVKGTRPDLAATH